MTPRPLVKPVAVLIVVVRALLTDVLETLNKGVVVGFTAIVVTAGAVRIPVTGTAKDGKAVVNGVKAGEITGVTLIAPMFETTLTTEGVVGFVAIDITLGVMRIPVVGIARIGTAGVAVVNDVSTGEVTGVVPTTLTFTPTPFAKLSINPAVPDPKVPVLADVPASTMLSVFAATPTG